MKQVLAVKEESDPLIERMKGELAHRGVMKGIFCANLGVNWLYASKPDKELSQALRDDLNAIIGQPS